MLRRTCSSSGANGVPLNVLVNCLRNFSCSRVSVSIACSRYFGPDHLHFRDEDARADRSPGEFYQLDIEMSFVEQEDVFQAVEPVLRDLFVEFGEGKRVTEQFPRIAYANSMRKYGSDKPDLRNPIEMTDVTEAFRDSGFKVFASQLSADKKVEVWAIPAPTGGSRAFCDRMNAWASAEGQPGLGYIFFRDDGEGRGRSPRTSASSAPRRSARS